VRSPRRGHHYLTSINTSNGDATGPTLTDSDIDTVKSNDITTTQHEESQPMVSQTVTFMEEAPLYRMDAVAPRDTTYTDPFADNLPLDKYFARPIQIATGTWTTTFTRSSLFEEINPWILWQQNERIANKLKNYAYASWDQAIRVVLNGTPFQYGKLMVVYIPYGDVGSLVTNAARNRVAREQVEWYNKSSAETDSAHDAVFQHFSTYPHVVMDPSKSTVAELKLPFMYHVNAFPVAGETFSSCGTLLFYDLNPLRIANPTALTQLNYTVYAWAENVSLTGATTLTATGSSESRVCSCLEDKCYVCDKVESKCKCFDQYILTPVSDEYNDPPVSAPASAVAEAAGMLTGVPVIGPFARATEIGASAVANMARLFGFSTPTMQVPVSRYTPKVHGRMANTIGEDSSYSLALDPKQELTVDPSTLGVKGVDEMAISSIVQREQWIARCEWNRDKGQFSTPGAEKIIFSALVSPNLSRFSGPFDVIGTTRLGRQDTPAGHLANVFRYWRGSITYRVEVVCSPYHSGRLKLDFDPLNKTDGSGSASPLAVSDVYTDHTESRYSMILDLAKTNEAEFTVDYISNLPWLRTWETVIGHNDGIKSFQPVNTADTSYTLYGSYNPSVHMGMFNVSVVNELVASNPTDGPASATQSPVQVNVYMKCGNDMQFAQPDELDDQSVGFQAAWSKAEFSIFQAVSAETSRVVDTFSELHTGSKSDLQNPQVFFGEQIKSIRALCKRYTLVDIQLPDGVGDANINYSQERIYPHYPKQVSDLTRSSRRNSYVTYFSPMYIARRGASRYKFLYYGGFKWPDKTGRVSSVQGPFPFSAGAGESYQFVERIAPLSTVDTIGYAPLNQYTLSPQQLNEALPHGYNGMAMTENSVQPVLEVESPFYSNTRFDLAANFVVSKDVAGEEPLVVNPTMYHILALRHIVTGLNADRNPMLAYQAAGEDFSCFFMTCCPGVWKTVTP